MSSLPLAVAALTPPQLDSPAPFALPPTTCGQPVGTTMSTLTDRARAEPFAPSEPRQVRAVVSYPGAAAAGQQAPYLLDGIADARAFATLVRAAPGSFDAIAEVASHALVARAIVREYFDRGLRGRRSPLASGASILPEASFAVLK